MIAWEQVRVGLLLKVGIDPLKDETLKGVLKHFYIKRKMSLSQICDLVQGEVTERPLREKMTSFGIKLRGKGGANYVKDFTLTFKEYNSLTLRQLRDLKKVSTHCIINKAKKLGFFNRKERRRNVKSK